MLTIADVSKSYGTRELFAEVSLFIARTDRLGLVGPNGAGKSTLFGLILGEEKPDTGTIEWERGADFGYLPQESAPAGDETILHIATSGKKLEPDEDDYFVLKPKHSGFFSTTLDTLLDYLGVKVLVLTGIAGNICILFTANDAYMRDFHLVVPADCVASAREEDNRHALEQMEKVLKADITPSTHVDFERLKQNAPCQPDPAVPQPQDRQFAHD